MDYTRLKRDELAVEMERLGLPPADSKMSKAVMLERIESFLASNGSVNGSDKPVSPTRRRSPRRQSPTRKSPRRNSPDRQQSRSPERLKAADTAVTVGDEDNSAQTEPQQTAQQRKKKRRNNKKNKVIERRPLVESSRPKLEGVEVEYVEPSLEELGVAADEEFSKIFARFALPPPPTAAGEEEPSTADHLMTEAAADAVSKRTTDKPEWLQDESDLESAGSDNYYDEEDGEGQQRPVSKKKLKRMARYTVAQLKALVKKPECVEWVDVTAADPKLLLHLKSYHNSVPVPMHWSAKRRYLATKRTTGKVQYDLPQYLKDTGIQEMRESLREKEQQMNLRAKMRAKVRPKLGKAQVDYQKLHDAFFRFQTKPHMSRHGELYYEGKEFEAKMRSKRAGVVSAELRLALGMGDDPLVPPPWLINMQRHGPPPSYPSLRIAGLNAPIPDGAQWGYHPGGWGKPPVNEYNQPLYGDVFGQYSQYQRQLQTQIVASNLTVPIEYEPWGEISELPEEDEAEQYEEESSEYEEEEAQPPSLAATETEPAEPRDGMETPRVQSSVAAAAAALRTGLQTPLLAGGLQTPAQLELRKKPSGLTAGSSEDGAKQLYTVIPERQVVQGLLSANSKTMMGSQHTYDLSAASLQKRKTTDGDIEADEMESGLSTAQLLKDKQQRADSTSEQQQAAKKRKTAEEAAGKKRFLKDFKF